MHHSKLKKADSRRYILFNFVKTIYKGREQVDSCNRLWLWRGLDCKRHKWIVLGEGTVQYLDCGGGYITVYTCQTHRTVYQKG